MEFHRPTVQRVRGCFAARESRLISRWDHDQDPNELSRLVLSGIHDQSTDRFYTYAHSDKDEHRDRANTDHPGRRPDSNYAIWQHQSKSNDTLRDRGNHRTSVEPQTN